jgi:hypothetical protein
MTRWIALLLLLAAQTAGESSVLHWTTRIMGMNCDNHLVRHGSKDGPKLAQRGEESDLVTPVQFTAERPFAPTGSLTLAVCNGEVHVEPSDTDTLRVSVQLNGHLHREETPRNYLQRFDTTPEKAVMLWKLPESAKPIFHVYIPRGARLRLDLGKSELTVQGILGDKELSVGRGTARLYVRSDSTDFSQISVDVAMGSFIDQRPGGKQIHKVPLHEDISGSGTAKVSLNVAMGKAEIAAQ